MIRAIIKNQLIVLISFFTLVGSVFGGTENSTEPTLIGKIVPFQSWESLSSRAKGLLVQQDFGLCLIDHGQYVPQIRPQPFHSTCRTGEANTYAFSLDGNSPIAIYFKSEGQGFNFLKNWKVSNGFESDAAQFSSTTSNKWGLKREAHVIETEVNGGTGSEGDVHFIATDVSVLDGTSAYPLDPAALIRRFLAPYIKEDTAQIQKIDTDLSQAVASLQAVNPTYTLVKNFERNSKKFAGFSATWIEKNESLQVVYYRRYEDSYIKRETQKPKCPPNAPCPPPPVKIRVWTWGAEYAIGAEFTRDGELKKTLLYPIEVFYRPAP